MLDEARLAKRLRQARRPKDFAAIARQIDAGELVVANRQAAVPTITYPDLPVSARREDLAAAIAKHQVVVVAGETGSGKTTQLPKICLELGRGIRGTIGHTQPRRLAARTVAQRIADELHTPLGDVVGYTVRFTDQVSDRTLIKLMTDGILLAEIQRDRMLRRYDTLILDEAHERSLNIDFLIGYLTELLPRRPDLKVIVTSATIDPQRFAAHFNDAPIVEVSGRTYPVEIRYRPLEPDATVDDEDDPDDPDHDVVHRIAPRDQTEAIIDAVHELEREQPGDVLVFLSGEREIRDTADALRGEQLRNTEVLPLYARLPTADQQKVFEATHRTSHRARHKRRRDLADRARHSLRHRPWHGTHLALQQAHEGAAAAHRADLASIRRATRRSVRAAVRRHLHPALLRTRLRLAATVHRSRDPADEPGRGPAADGRAAHRRCRAVPVPRPTRSPLRT